MKKNIRYDLDDDIQENLKDGINNSMLNESGFKVIDVQWERTFLSILIKKERVIEQDIILYSKKYNIEIPLEWEKLEEDVYKTTIHIVSVDQRSFLDNGKWFVTYKGESLNELGETEEKYYTANIDFDLAYNLDEKTRVFKYGTNNIYAYMVSFKTQRRQNGVELEFVLDSFFAKQNNKWRKRNFIEEIQNTKKLKGKLEYAISRMGLNVIYKFFCLISPKKDNTVLFMTETKNYVSGNLKIVSERLTELNDNKQYKVTYSCRNAVGTHKSKLSWIIMLKKIANVRYIFVDDYIPAFSFLHISKNTKLIQLWHAGIGFKSVGYARFGKAGSPYPQDSVHKKYDYGIVGGEHARHVYQEVWGIDKESILPYGLPRLDGFLNKEKIENYKNDFYTQYPKCKEKKIILFCPTYRGVGQKVAYYNYDVLDFNKIYEVCGDEYIFAFKMHPFVSELPEIPKEYRDRIIDLSSVQNINDLYYVTEVLITDYSSSFYEFSLLEKPVLFYTYDREIYELSRGVHLPVKETAPGKVCDTFEELIDAINEKDFEIEKTLEFKRNNFKYLDDHATDRILQKIVFDNK